MEDEYYKLTVDDFIYFNILRKRDTPIKPKYVSNGIYVCGNNKCSRVVLRDDNVCRKCGNKIDWRVQ